MVLEVEIMFFSVNVGVYVSAMDIIKPTEALSLDGNVNANWKTFRQRFLLYMSAIGVTKEPD
jgi:hypothetical protein